MRKIIFLLSAILINLSVAFSQSLSTETFSVANSNLPLVGSTFNVPININALPATIRSIDVYLLYDPSVLNFIGTTNLQNVSAQVITTGSDANIGMLKLVYSNINILTNITVSNGKLFDVQFKFNAGNSNLNFDITTPSKQCKYRVGSTNYNITTVTNGSITGGYVNNTLLSGLWQTASNWSLNVVPNSYHNVFVAGIDTVSSNAIAYNLTINSGAALTLNREKH